MPLRSPRENLRKSLIVLLGAVLLGIFLRVAILSTVEPATAPRFPGLDEDPFVFAFKQGIFAGLALALGGALFPYARRRKWLLAGLLFIGVTPLALGGFWFSPDTLGRSDWDYHFSHDEALRRIVLAERTLPLWNPYTCGGTAGLANPEFAVISPVFLLELLLGVPLGVRLGLYGSFIVGGLGMLALGRALHLSPMGALVAAIGAYFSSFLLLHTVEGHLPIVLAAMWVPWIFWSGLRAYQRGGWWIVLSSIFIALTFYQGGIYILSYVAVASGLLIALARDKMRAASVFGLAWLLAGGLAAVKAIPLAAWMTQFGDEQYATSAATMRWLPQILLGRYVYSADWRIPGQEVGWHEYGAYVGPFLLALSFFSLLAWKQKSVRWLVGGAAGALLLSSAGPLLAPVFDQLPFLPRSNVSRFIWFGVLAASLLAGIGFDAVQTGRPRWRWLRPALLGLVAMDMMSLAYPLSEQVFVLPEAVALEQPLVFPITFTRRDHAYRYHGADYTRDYSNAALGYGTLSYCSPLGPKPAVVAIEQDEDPAFIVWPSEQGVARLEQWRSDHFVVDIEAERPGIVTVNQNFARGWEVQGQPAMNMNGRLAAAVPAGHSRLLFTYRTAGLSWGLAVTALSLLTIAGAGIWHYRKMPQAGTPLRQRDVERGGAVVD